MRGIHLRLEIDAMAAVQIPLDLVGPHALAFVKGVGRSLAHLS